MCGIGAPPEKVMAREPEWRCWEMLEDQDTSGQERA